MNVEPHNLLRLGNAVRIRREELGLQQTDLKRRGGPSSTTLSLIERGLYEMTPLMLRRLDQGLDWMDGSAADVLAGLEPTPIPRARPVRPKMGTETHRVWAIVNTLTGRIAASLQAQADLYEWTKVRLPASEQAEHESFAEAAAEPLVNASAEFAQLVANLAASPKKEKEHVMEAPQKSSAPETGDKNTRRMSTTRSTGA